MENIKKFREDLFNSLKDAEKIQQFIINTRSDLKSTFPFIKNSDIRVSSINTILQHSRILIVKSRFIDFKSSSYELQDILLAERFLRFHYFIDVFSSFENCIRILMRKTENENYYKNPDFVSFIKFKTETDDNTNVLQFSKLIRNCIHNNGFYFPDKKKNEFLEINYRENTFNFRIGEPIQFLTWEMLFLIVEDIIKLLINIFSSAKISSVEYFRDPVSLYESIE
jgi:hypothetical protein